METYEPNITTNLYNDYKINCKRSINIIHTLQQREYGNAQAKYIKEPVFTLTKRVYLSIYPNLTIINTKIPQCYIKRFSPNGQFLIAYNTSLNGIHIYKYNGCTRIQQYINQHYGDDTDTGSRDKFDLHKREYDLLRENLFDLLFTEIKNLRVTSINTEQTHDVSNELINREFSLFFESNYLLLASSEQVNDEVLPSYEQLTPNNEAIHINPIENYTFYLINLGSLGSSSSVSTSTPRVCDRIQFKFDKITLTHSNGAHLYKNIFTVMSQQNQTLYVYRIIDRYNYELDVTEKYFQLTHKIGRFCYLDDENYIKSTLHGVRMDKAFNETIITGLKHKILTYFYKNKTTSSFYMSYNMLMDLRMYKHQMLDDRHLFIKFVNSEFMLNQQKANGFTASSAHHDTLQAQLFVLYDYVDASVRNVYTSSSLDLYTAFENLNDFFTLSSVDAQFNYHTIAANNIYARQTFQRNIRNVSKVNTQTEIMNALLSQLPISAQSYTLTPYLDHTLFSYDEKVISSFDRPKAIGDTIVRFYIRETDRLAFKLYPGLQDKAPMNAAPIQLNLPNEPFLIRYAPSVQRQHQQHQQQRQQQQQQQQGSNVNQNQNLNELNTPHVLQHNALYKRLVAFIWHPYEPFCISVQRATQEYNVNFHIFYR